MAKTTKGGGGGSRASPRQAAAAAAAAKKKAAPQKKTSEPTKHTSKKESKKELELRKKLQQQLMSDKSCMAWRGKLGLFDDDADGDDNNSTTEGQLQTGVPYTFLDNQQQNNTTKSKKQQKKAAKTPLLLTWPSTVFFNATYANGILVNNSSSSGSSSKKQRYFVPTKGYSNKMGDRKMPRLTKEEAKLWCQKHAAHTAVARRFPVEVGRILGTITLEIKEVVVAKNNKKSKKKGAATTTTKSSASFKSDPNALVPESLLEIEQKMMTKNHTDFMAGIIASTTSNKHSGWVKKISVKQATEEAEAELSSQNPTGSVVSRDRILARAKEIQEQWNYISSCEPYKETWDFKDGNYDTNIGGRGNNKDEQFVNLKALQSWLSKGIKSGTLVDVNKDATKNLYNGLTRVPINATDIIKELVNMSNPQESIYGVPLICAYPRLSRSSSTTTGSSGGGKAKSATGGGGIVWKIQLGVYMNRLLPEIFSSRSLHIIMSALDEGSYTCTQPLQLPPTGPDVFKSAPYPKVDTSVLERKDHSGDGEDDDDESKSSGDTDENKIEIIDVDKDDDMEGGSRDELVISPFSVKGLLKLLENRGCDVSNWPQIERELQGKFQLDLLLHQQHAIAWMIQMEHLKGAYGINSLLWEERAFPDGGRYYYSPALGQLRLGAPPPHMRGGLVCDEQGLGKTVEVLGLIMATLPELKERLDKKKKAVASPTTVDGDDFYSAESSGDEEQDYITHTTLIIVPPALLAQWAHEIEKAVGKKTLQVATLTIDGDLKQTLPPPAASSDGDDDMDDDVDDWDRVLASDVVLTTYDALDKPSCQRVLQPVQWGRVVLDEMQEIRSSTTKIAKNCEKLQCNRRWMLSGTPIYEGIGDLKGELNFLRLEPFGASWEDGFFDFAIKTPWEMKVPRAVDTLQILGLIALRRSKDMTVAATGAGLLDLKPMTVEYIPVPQSRSERALYCWMEWLVACELELNKDSKKNKRSSISQSPSAKEKSNAKSRALCLRLLRELCITPMLLNGGLGCSSQLKDINKLMTSHNQREHRNNVMLLNDDGDDGNPAHKGGGVPVMSCDQALRFLSQHQQTARTGNDDMVTDMVVGGGRGATNRDRATEDPQIRYKEAKDDVARAQRSLSALTKNTAKARWHFALELITTGQYSDGRQHKFSGLWRWRKMVYIAGEQKAQVKTPKAKKNQALPAVLTRGWRPSADLLQQLFMKSKSDFSWSHPHSLLATNIPKEVYQKELATSMRDAAKQVTLAREELDSYNAQLSKLTQSKYKNKKDNEKRIKELEAKCQKINEKMDSYKEHDSKLKLPHVVKVRERKNAHGFWKAVIHFDTREQKEAVLAMCGRAQGVTIISRRNVPHMKALVTSAEDKLSVATAENQVHPSIQHKKNLAAAKKQVANLTVGLRMVTPTNTSVPTMNEEISKEAGTDQPYVLVSKGVGNQRSLAPRNISALIESAEETFDEYETEVPRLKSRIINGEETMKILKKAVSGKVSPQIAQLSAYETLEALSNGDTETKTQCSICLGYLGEAETDIVGPATAGSKRKRGEVAITMISCGHFYCTRCVRMYLNSGAAGCPACRKPFSLATDTILINTDLKDEHEARKKEREAAKELVCAAAKLLTDSKGSLEAELWRALYLSFDLPTNVPRLGSQTFSAIPREFLMHLRAATGMQPNQRPKTRPSVKGGGRNSKIEALLHHLPKEERCVVFSSNKDCLLHLREIFKDDKIGYQLLYKGLSTDELREAVTKWESDGHGSGSLPFPVLLVHAGAASAGLTLTAASKMFIMEPFLRMEQEHQAYARCHRYSQKHRVSAKVFYTPVSVESRLLEWRKGGKSSLLVSEDKDAENCNFGEQNTDFVIHDMDSDLDDESDEEEEDDDYESYENGSNSGGKRKKNREQESHDIAQANYLLGLVD